MDIDAWMNEVMEGLSGMPSIVAYWKNRPLYQNRIYGRFHREGDPILACLNAISPREEKPLLLTFYGDESDAEVEGLERIFVANIDVLKSIMTELSPHYTQILVGPVASCRSGDGENGLYLLKDWWLSQSQLTSTLIVYHSEPEFNPNSGNWLNLVQHCEEILK